VDREKYGFTVNRQSFIRNAIRIDREGGSETSRLIGQFLVTERTDRGTAE